ERSRIRRIVPENREFSDASSDRVLATSSRNPKLQRVKLAFSSNAYTKFSLWDALRGIKNAGFAAVEILADVPHAYPMDMDSSLAITLSEELERTQLAVSNV